MVYFIKEAFKVYINDMLIAFVDVLLRLLDALVCVFVGSETVAVIFKFKLELWCDALCNCLLQPSVCQCWNTKQPGFTVALWDVYSQDGLRQITSLDNA